MPAPTLQSAAIDTTGLALTLVWSIATGNLLAVSAPSVSVNARAFACNYTYASGTGTTTLVYTLDSPVYEGETALFNAAAGIAADAASGLLQNAAISQFSITNSSTVVPPATGPAIRMMRNTCSISRPTIGQSSSSGGQTSSWTEFYTNVRCSVQGTGTEEPEEFMRENAGMSYKVFFPPLTDIRASDRLDDFTGNAALRFQTLEVDGMPIDHAGRGAYLYVVARSINLDG